MDSTASASSSFESASDNDTKQSSSLIGDGDGANGTLYDSALDQLSTTTTTFKSCDGELALSNYSFPILENGAYFEMSKCQCLELNLQLDPIHHESEQMPRSHRYDSSYGSRLTPCKTMQHQLEETSSQHDGPVTAPKITMHHNQSMLQHENNELRHEQAHLTHQLYALQQSTSALQVEIGHMEQYIEDLTVQCTEKGQINNNIKATLLTAADEVMKAQTAESLPSEFLSKIFTIFDDDSKLKELFKNLDDELSEIISNFCTEAYEERKEPLAKVIDRKVEKLRQDLVKKYEKQLKECEKKHQLNGLALKCKCFDILSDFLKNKESDSEDYIKELKSIYEEETRKL